MSHCFPNQVNASQHSIKLLLTNSSCHASYTRSMISSDRPVSSFHLMPELDSVLMSRAQGGISITPSCRSPGNDARLAKEAASRQAHLPLRQRSALCPLLYPNMRSAAPQPRILIREIGRAESFV